MTLTLQPGTIYSVTTLTTVTHGNVSGAVPEDTAFALPYADSFDGYKNDSYPRYLADQGGSFTVLNDVPGEAAGGVLRQMTPVNSVENSWGLNSDPISLIGDLSWENTAVSVFGKVVTDAVSATSTPAPLQVAPCVPARAVVTKVAGNVRWAPPERWRAVPFGPACGALPRSLRPN